MLIGKKSGETRGEKQEGSGFGVKVRRKGRRKKKNHGRMLREMMIERGRGVGERGLDGSTFFSKMIN